MVKSDWLEEGVREKDEWRFATMEYGGQCVQIMAGMKWMLVSSVNSWISFINKLCQPTAAILELVKVQYYWKISDAIQATQTCHSVWTSVLVFFIIVNIQLEWSVLNILWWVHLYRTSSNNIIVIWYFLNRIRQLHITFVFKLGCTSDYCHNCHGNNCGGIYEKESGTNGK